MFEQTFIQKDAHDKKRYTVLVSLLMQIATLAAFMILPLVYTQVLPQAHLQNVFAAPTPPPPTLPKAPAATTQTISSRPIFRPSFLVPLVNHPIQRNVEMAAAAAPDLPVGTPAGESLLAPNAAEGTQAKPPDPPAAKQPSNQRVRRASMEPSQLIYRVQPAYPTIARQTRVQGVVVFTAVISKRGTIENLQLVHGHPLLVTAAKEAILQWRYKPTLLSGEPVEVVTNIFVNFSLTQ